MKDMLPCNLPNTGPEPPEVVDLTQDANISNVVVNEIITLDDSISKPGEIVTVSDSDSDIEATNAKPAKQLKSSHRRPQSQPDQHPPQLQSRRIHSSMRMPLPSTIQTLPLTIHPQSRPEPPPLSPPNALKCPICIETFVDIKKRGGKTVVTKCGHLFCQLCLKKSISDNDRKCPKCRKYIPKSATSIIEVFDVS